MLISPEMRRKCGGDLGGQVVGFRAGDPVGFHRPQRDLRRSSLHEIPGIFPEARAASCEGRDVVDERGLDTHLLVGRIDRHETDRVGERDERPRFDVVERAPAGRPAQCDVLRMEMPGEDGADAVRGEHVGRLAPIADEVAREVLLLADEMLHHAVMHHHDHGLVQTERRSQHGFDPGYAGRGEAASGSGVVRPGLPAYEAESTASSHNPATGSAT